MNLSECRVNSCININSVNHNGSISCRNKSLRLVYYSRNFFIVHEFKSKNGNILRVMLEKIIIFPYTNVRLIRFRERRRMTIKYRPSLNCRATLKLLFLLVDTKTASSLKPQFIHFSFLCSKSLFQKFPAWNQSNFTPDPSSSSSPMNVSHPINLPPSLKI